MTTAAYNRRVRVCTGLRPKPCHPTHTAALLATLLVWLASVPSLAWAASEEAWVFVIHPFDTPSRIYTRFRPLLDYLASKLERPLRLHIASDYEEQVHMLATGAAHLAYMGPTPYVRARARSPIQIIAGETQDGRAFYQSVIVVRESSPVRRLADLKGARLALGAEISFGSAVVPRYMLQQAGLQLSDLGGVTYLQRHEQVALAVLHGDYDAGGLRLEIAKAYLPRGLRILATSQPLPPHVIATAAPVPAAEVERIRAALLTPDARGLGALAALGAGIGFVEIDDRQYDAVRRLLKELER